MKRRDLGPSEREKIGEKGDLGQREKGEDQGYPNSSRVSVEREGSGRESE